MQMYAKLILLKMIFKIQTFSYVYFASRDYIQVAYQRASFLNISTVSLSGVSQGCEQRKCLPSPRNQLICLDWIHLSVAPLRTTCKKRGPHMAAL